MKDIIKSIKENTVRYQVFAVRALADDEQYQVGDICRNSYDWDYENDVSSFLTDNPVELDGACGKHIVDIDRDSTDDEIIQALNDTLEKFNYYGEKVIIAGCYYDYGSDESEVIITDAEVIAKLD